VIASAVVGSIVGIASPLFPSRHVPLMSSWPRGIFMRLGCCDAVWRASDVAFETMLISRGCFCTTV
jgi:hypothetical protein